MLKQLSETFGGFSSVLGENTENKKPHQPLVTKKKPLLPGAKPRRRRRNTPASDGGAHLAPLNKAEHEKMQQLLNAGQELPANQAKLFHELQDATRVKVTARPSPLSLPSLPGRSVLPPKQLPANPVVVETISRGVLDDQTNQLSSRSPTANRQNASQKSVGQSSRSRSKSKESKSKGRKPKTKTKSGKGRQNSRELGALKADILRQQEILGTGMAELATEREELASKFAKLKIADEKMAAEREAFEAEKVGLMEREAAVRRMERRVQDGTDGEFSYAQIEASEFNRSKQEEVDDREADLIKGEKQLETERAQLEREIADVTDAKKRVKVQEKSLDCMFEECENERAVNEKETLRLRRDKERCKKKKDLLRQREEEIMKNPNQSSLFRQIEKRQEKRADDLHRREDELRNKDLDLNRKLAQAQKQMDQFEQLRRSVAHDKEEVQKDKERAAVKARQLQEEAETVEKSHRHLAKLRQDLKEQSTNLQRAKLENQQTNESTMRAIEEERTRLEAAKLDLERRRASFDSEQVQAQRMAQQLNMQAEQMQTANFERDMAAETLGQAGSWQELASLQNATNWQELANLQNRQNFREMEQNMHAAQLGPDHYREVLREHEAKEEQMYESALSNGLGTADQQAEPFSHVVNDENEYPAETDDIQQGWMQVEEAREQVEEQRKLLEEERIREAEEHRRQHEQDAREQLRQQEQLERARAEIEAAKLRTTVNEQEDPQVTAERSLEAMREAERVYQAAQGNQIPRDGGGRPLESREEKQKERPRRPSRNRQQADGDSNITGLLDDIGDISQQLTHPSDRSDNEESSGLMTGVIGVATLVVGSILLG